MGSGWLPPSRWPPLWSLPCTGRLECWLSLAGWPGSWLGFLSGEPSVGRGRHCTPFPPRPLSRPSVFLPPHLPLTSQCPAPGKPQWLFWARWLLRVSFWGQQQGRLRWVPLGLCLPESSRAVGPGRTPQRAHRGACPVWRHGDPWEQNSGASLAPQSKGGQRGRNRSCAEPGGATGGHVGPSSPSCCFPFFR